MAASALARQDRAAALKVLEADAAKIVRQGFAFEPSRLTPGVHDIGAPIRAPSGEAIASLTVPYLAHRYYGAPITEVKRMVVAAAKEISAGLR